MRIEAIRTRVMVPPKDDLYEVIKESIKKVPEKSILVVTSKVVAIHQERCIPISAGVERDCLAKKEADFYADRDMVPGEHLMFTIKNNSLVASSGIDKSNSKGHFILWPENVDESAREIHAFLKNEYCVEKLGVIITDSHVIPLRRGLVGQAIGWFGLNPLHNYIGKKDIFGGEMMVSMKDVVDGLATAAVVVQGEADEQTPLAVISDVDWVEFSEDEKVNRGEPDLLVPLGEDLFTPMLEAVEWKKGGGGLSKKEIDKLKKKK